MPLILYHTGYVNLRLRRDSIAIHLLHLQRKHSEVSDDSSTKSSSHINHLKPDLLDDTPSSINFVSELLTSDKTIKSRSREENGESIEHSAKVKFTIPANGCDEEIDGYRGNISNDHLLALRESAAKGKIQSLILPSL